MNPKLYAALIIAVVLLVFTAQNYEVVSLRFLVWEIEASRAVLILGVFLTGIVVDRLISGLSHLRRRG